MEKWFIVGKLPSGEDVYCSTKGYFNKEADHMYLVEMTPEELRSVIPVPTLSAMPGILRFTAHCNDSLDHTSFLLTENSIFPWDNYEIAKAWHEAGRFDAFTAAAMNLLIAHEKGDVIKP